MVTIGKPKKPLHTNHLATSSKIPLTIEKTGLLEGSHGLIQNLP